MCLKVLEPLTDVQGGHLLVPLQRDLREHAGAEVVAVGRIAAGAEHAPDECRGVFVVAWLVEAVLAEAEAETAEDPHLEVGGRRGSGSQVVNED